MPTPVQARQQVACSLPRRCTPLVRCMRQWHQALWHTSACQQLVSINWTPPPRQEEQMLKQACFWGCPNSAVRIQVSIDSQNSAIHNAYRSSLRPSSLLKPRHPSLNVVVKSDSHSSTSQKHQQKGGSNKHLAKRLGRRRWSAPPHPSAHEALPKQLEQLHPQTELRAGG